MNFNKPGDHCLRHDCYLGECLKCEGEVLTHTATMPTSITLVPEFHSLLILFLLNPFLIVRLPPTTSTRFFKPPYILTTIQARPFANLQDASKIRGKSIHRYTVVSITRTDTFMWMRKLEYMASVILEATLRKLLGQHRTKTRKLTSFPLKSYSRRLVRWRG